MAKFQSEIPSTSGAICEKLQGGPFAPPPPAGRGLKESYLIIKRKDGERYKTKS